MNNVILTLGGAGVIVMVIVGLNVDPTYVPPAEVGTQTIEPNDARAGCQRLLEEVLHDPKGAEFNRYDWVVEGSTLPVTVQLKLRARNGFGGLRLVSGTCVLSKYATNGVAGNVFLD